LASSKSPGQVNFEGYAEQTENRSLATGDELPVWDMLPRDIQDAWDAGAAAVLLDDAQKRSQENKPAD
jgi:hypothetical protein